MTDRVPTDRLHIDPDTQSPHDETLINLLIEQMQGRLEMYEAAVPIKYIRPFSPTYKPQSASWWGDLVYDLAREIYLKRPPALLTYQVGDFFVMSDDYPAYYAYLEYEDLIAEEDAEPIDVALCHVLGKPHGDHVGLYWPLAESALHRAGVEEGGAA